MVYFCDRCGYTTKYRNNFKNHLNRKKPCIASHADVEIKKIKQAYDMSSDDEELIEELELPSRCVSVLPPGVEDVINDVLDKDHIVDGEIVLDNKTLNIVSVDDKKTIREWDINLISGEATLTPMFDPKSKWLCKI